MSECQWHPTPPTGKAINLQEIVLQCRTTNQHACRVTAQSISVAIFRGWLLLVFMKMDRAGSSQLPPLPFSTAQWWETPSGGEMYQCRSKPSKTSCHIHRTESIITNCSQGRSNNRSATRMQFSSLRWRKMKCLLWMWMMTIWTLTPSSQTYTLQCVIHWSTWEISAGITVTESWLRLCVAHRRKKQKNTSDMTECVLHGAGHCCHGDSVTHGSLIWI